MDKDNIKELLGMFSNSMKWLKNSMTNLYQQQQESNYYLYKMWIIFVIYYWLITFALLKLNVDMSFNYLVIIKLLLSVLLTYLTRWLFNAYKN